MEQIAIITFIAVIVLVVTEKVHRTAAALGGAVVLLATHVLSIDQAVGHIDFNTIGVLLGMMMFVAVVKESGLFEYLAIKTAKMTKGNPWRIMVAFMILTAVLSAFLDNVTTVLLIGPMTIAITAMLDINPVPFLMTQIVASNIGGTATLIGDPPNIMIGSSAGFGFMDFIINTGLPSIIVLAVIILYSRFVYGRGLNAKPEAIQAVMGLDEKKAITNPALMRKSIIMIALVVIGFMFHGMLDLEASVIALGAGVIMLIIGRQNVEDMIHEVEWPTILFFIGLFVVVGGLVEVGVIDKLASFLVTATAGKEVVTILVLLWATALCSAVLDNIPFVATLIPLLLAMESGGMDVEPLWWAVSLGACLGGNGTLIGASANVVLSGISNKNGYPITFASYLKFGFPVMVISMIICSVYMLLKFAI